jgi:hypothetical protein
LGTRWNRTARNVPEYALAFVVASTGTSLPKAVVDVTALRAGRSDLVFSDAIGSPFVDVTERRGDSLSGFGGDGCEEGGSRGGDTAGNVIERR